MKRDSEVEAFDAVLSAVAAISRPLEQNVCMGWIHGVAVCSAPSGLFQCALTTKSEGCEMRPRSRSLEVSAGQAGEREHGDSAKELPWDR